MRFAIGLPEMIGPFPYALITFWIVFEWVV
jgi:hypothetical protein